MTRENFDKLKPDDPIFVVVEGYTFFVKKVLKEDIIIGKNYMAINIKGTLYEVYAYDPDYITAIRIRDHYDKIQKENRRWHRE